MTDELKILTPHKIKKIVRSKVQKLLSTDKFNENGFNGEAIEAFYLTLLTYINEKYAPEIDRELAELIQKSMEIQGYANKILLKINGAQKRLRSEYLEEAIKDRSGVERLDRRLTNMDDTNEEEQDRRPGIEKLS